MDLEGAGGKAEVEPIELLHAAQPDGIVAYFTALSFHELTTQIPTSHHIVSIARVGSEKKPSPIPEELAQRDEPSLANRRSRNSLGTHLFNFDGVGYYESRRSLRVPDILIQYLSPRSMVRITGVMQTLVDCLHVPQRCGGPETVFEAWETGIEKLDESLLGKCLTEMNHFPTTRRVGAMLKLLDYQVKDAYLRRAFETSCLDLSLALDLLPGFNYSSLNPRWGVRVPQAKGRS